MIDLFGNLVLESELHAHREKAKRKTIPKGYAAPPGSGPKGEYCRTCEFAVKHLKFWKCYLRRRTWSSCYATDIRLKSTACLHWELKKLTPFKCS